MTEIAVIIIGQADESLWGLNPETRLARVTTRAGAGHIKSLIQIGPEEPALLIRADAVIEERLIRALLAQPGLILTAVSHNKEETIALAARVNGKKAAEEVIATMTGILPESPLRASLMVLLKQSEAHTTQFFENTPYPLQPG